MVGVAAVGCDESPPEQTEGQEQQTSSDGRGERSAGEGPEIVHPEGVEPGPDSVVGRAGDIEVNLADYDRFLRRSRLFAPGGKRGGKERRAGREIPPERKASPRLQVQTVRSLLERRVLERVAEERGVEVSDEAVDSFIREHDKLGRWASALEPDAGGGAGLPDGLSASDLRTVARARLVRRKLRDELVERPSAEELWELYRRRNTGVRIAYVALQNAPEPAEIDSFVERHSGGETSRIREHFEQHRKKYRRSRLVEITGLRSPSGEEVEESKLEEAAERLESGEPPEEVAAELGLEIEESSYLRRRENPQAFGAEEGAAGYQMDGPRGAYAWRVEGWREGKTAELDRSLRREIAAELLRKEVVPSVGDRLESILDLMRRVAERSDWPISREELAPVREALGGDAELEVTEKFAKRPDDNVPGLGLAEPVMEAAFELSPEDPVADEPILNRERAVALMLVDRDEASREQFEEGRESFRRRIVDQRRRRAVQNYLDEWFSEHEPSTDLEPVQATYGRLEK